MNSETNGLVLPMDPQKKCVPSQLKIISTTLDSSDNDEEGVEITSEYLEANKSIHLFKNSGNFDNPVHLETNESSNELNDSDEDCVDNTSRHFKTTNFKNNLVKINNHISEEEIKYNIDKTFDSSSSTSHTQFNPTSAESDIGKSIDKTQQFLLNFNNTRATKVETFKIVSIEQQASDQEERSVDSSDDGESDDDPEAGSRARDIVSINSDSDVEINEEKSSKSENKSDEVIILENDGNDSQHTSTKSPEVQEIDSDNNDDCVVTDHKTSNGDSIQLSVTKISLQKSNISKENSKDDCVPDLRRSSRPIKRRMYDDEDDEGFENESDVEEVVPTKKSFKTIYKTDFTKETVKETKVILIDSPIKNRMNLQSKPNNSSMNPNIYKNIPACISVTQKTVATNLNSAPQPTPILPTLSDDMFVVEAPSFIVPYVYEKPAMIPFKEFVKNWGIELEDEKKKEDLILLGKQIEEKETKDKEKQERREKGEEVTDTDDEENAKIKKLKIAKKKADRKSKEKRRKNEDDVSWDGSASENESEDSSSDDEESSTVSLKSSPAVTEVSPVVTEGYSDLTANPAGKSDSYFDLFLGKFFMNIGINLVQEYVQSDLLKQQNRKLHREKKSGQSTAKSVASIMSLTKNLELSQKNNKGLTFTQKKCGLCSFKTESSLVMDHHLEVPHMRNNMYKCNYCIYETKSPQDILFHMETIHEVKAKLERAPYLHQCPNCPFEDNAKGKLARHLIACAKKFKPDRNLAPPPEWEHPAKIAKIGKNRNSVGQFPLSHYGRNHVDNSGKVIVPIINAVPYRPRARNPPALRPPPPAVPTPVRGLTIRHSTAQYIPNTYGPKPKGAVTVTPYMRQPAPGAHPSVPSNSKGFVICEICDGYIKDLDQLRNHMQWIHKVRIHPKMIYNRPPLNCQKCQFRFFTDQGLERHLLGSHGLVTSSMQEAAFKGKDAGRCPICGRVYQWKLLNHVAKEHNLMLKPAHLSYKCTVCTAIFGMYKQFESHVYSAHSVVAKKVIDKKANATIPKPNEKTIKSLKINDEITITQQPLKVTAEPATKDK